MFEKKATEWIEQIHHNGKHIATVQVRHWQLEPSGIFGTGGNMWNVYLILFSDTPIFEKFTDPDNLPDIPMHGGVTYYTKSEVKPYGDAYTMIKIGCDYNHLHDEHHTFREGENPTVFCDAQGLVEWVQRYMEDK